MKKNALIFCLAFALLFGCPITPPEPPEKLPQDFEVEYYSGATHLEWGQYILEIDSEGNAVFEKTIQTALSKKYEFSVSESERKKIYDAVVVNSFFSLNDRYEDPFVMDGGFSRISIKADGKRKTVSVVNYSQEQFNKVESEIGKLITSKVGEKAFSFTDLMDDCEEKETECKGKEEDFECIEWKEFCAWEEEISAEYCDKQSRRIECMNYCLENDCEKELCDALMFDAKDCTECSPGCCSLCNTLDECGITGCFVSWIHPSGESWQFGGCENTDLCSSFEWLCDYFFTSYQGYAYHSATEEDQEKALEYQTNSDAILALYEENCE